MHLLTSLIQLIDRACAQYRHIHKRCIYCEMLEARVVSLSLWRSLMVMQSYIAVLVWTTESVIQYDC